MMISSTNSKRNSGGRSDPGLLAVLLLAVAGLLAAPAIAADPDPAPEPTKAQGADKPEAAKNDPERVLTGDLLPAQILNFTPEWLQNFRDYTPDPEAVEKIRAITSKIKQDLKAEVIVATWCGDSRRQVPRFMKVQRTLQRDRLPVKFMGVDRSIQNPPEVAEGRNLKRVPTFIIYHKGAEIGRIVETPKVSIEADLAAILAKAAGN